MTDDLIKEMASRFLQWKLPPDFAPDNGIVFVPTYRGPSGAEYTREPTGTNLLTFTQAQAMIRHMIGQTE